MNQIQKRVEELSLILEKANFDYYVKSEPTMTDLELIMKAMNCFAANKLL